MADEDKTPESVVSGDDWESHDEYATLSRFDDGQQVVINKPSVAQFGEHFDPEKQEYVPHRRDFTDGEDLVELKGQEVTVSGQPYQAQAGPHAGKTMVPCELGERQGGALVAVPEDRLVPSKKKIAVTFEMTDERYRELFGHAPPDPN
jgi:hypothetical protein